MIALVARLLMLSTLSLATVALAEPVTFGADDGARPRSGQTLIAQPVLQHTVVALDAALDKGIDAVLVIGHATGEAGQLSAEALRAWLVALGVSSARIRLEARTELSDALVLDVRDKAGL